jgi:hypothetical protein
LALASTLCFHVDVSDPYAYDLSYWEWSLPFSNLVLFSLCSLCDHSLHFQDG